MISVIIISNNNINDLKRCINNVIMQSFKNIEIIIIDKYLNKEISTYINNLKLDINIRYIDIDNNIFKDSYLKNVGIDNSNGDYICFINNLSEFSLDKFETMINIFNKNKKVDIILSNINLYINYDNGNIVKKYESNLTQDNYKKEILLNPIYFNFANPIVKRKILINNNNFDQNLETLDDYEILIKLLFKYNVYIIEDILTEIDLDKNYFNNINISDYKTEYEYIIYQYKSLFEKIENKKIKEYNYLNIIENISLIKRNKYNFKDSLKKKLKIKFNIYDLLLLLVSFLNMKRLTKIKLIFDIKRFKL